MSIKNPGLDWPTDPLVQLPGTFASLFDPVTFQSIAVDPFVLAGDWTGIWPGADLNTGAVIPPDASEAVLPVMFGVSRSIGGADLTSFQAFSSAGTLAPPVTVTTSNGPGPVGSQGSLLLVAGLANKTGPSLSSTSTSDDTIAGRAIDTAAIVSLTASIDGGSVLSETSAIGAGGGFTLTPVMIAALAGGSLTNGAHTVLVTATDGSGNMASAGVSFTLDSVAPALSAGLSDATGTSTLAQTMGATSNDTVAGTGTDTAGIISLYGTLDGVRTYSNLTSDIGSNGAFTITPAVLNSLAGGTLRDGHHSLVLQATDTAGNVTSETVGFTLETTLGVPTLALASADQTTSATTTDASSITLLGTTTPEAIVTLISTGATATSGQTGLFQFPDVPVSTGSNAFAVQVTDLAGNTSNASLNVVQANTGGTDPVIEWDTITNQAITTDASPPTVATRALAIESLSVYNAVAAIDGTPGFDSSLTAPSDANAQAAVIAAADAALDSLYPAQAAGFDARATADLAAIPNSLSKTKGVAVGKAAAAAELALRANDGSANSVTDTGSQTPGQWQPTPPAYAPALTPQWATLTPFALESASQFLPAAPPAIGTPAYAAAVNETYSLGGLNSTARTPAETQAALFWNLPTGTDTPAGEWNVIASTVAQTNGLGLSEDALLFAELNVAEGDGGIATWNGKFTYSAWRPITVFTDPTIASVNPLIDSSSTWTSLIATPNFPEYPEGHGVFSGAAATVLASFFGDNTTFTVPSQTLPGGAELTFTSFSSAADNAAMSRIWGGIHFTFSAAAALTVGDEVGAWTLGAFNTSTDTTPPKVTLNNVSGGTTNQDPTITGVVSSGFGVAALNARLPDGTTVNVPLNSDGSFSYTVPDALNGSADGTQEVTFTAVDPAGNQSPALNYTFTLITQAPGITLAGGSVTNNATIGASSVLDGTIGLEAGDSLQSLTYSFDGGTATPIVVNPATGVFDTPIAVSALTPGPHELVLTALDAAGNATTKYMPVVYALPPLILTSITPTVGTSDVGVTFRPSITFSRAVNTSTLNSTDFYATDSSGAVLSATVVPYTDGTGAWLLPTGTWPASSVVTLHVVGQDITAADKGAELDAADVGTPGTSLSESFTTVAGTPIPGTTITGIVVDPGPDGTPFTIDDVKSSVGNSTDYASDTWKLPIAGATVYILGDEQDAVTTAANGSFTLTNVPAGDVKVVVDGTTATNPPSGYYFPAMTLDINVKAGVANTIPADMGTPAEQAGMAGDPAVYLPRVADDALMPISSTQPTTVTAANNSDLGSGAFTMTQQQLSELSLTVQANSIVDANGNPVANPTVGIAPVPASIVQDMLPAGLMQHSFDITIQAPGGSVFTSGATLTMPNVFGLAPGEQTYILSFDHTTGRLVIDGTASASADGQTVTTNPNTAIMAPGWHGMTPPGSNGNGNVGDDYPSTYGAAYAAFLKAEGQANPTAMAIVTGGNDSLGQASNAGGVVTGTAGALGASHGGLTFINGVSTGMDAANGIHNFATNASQVANQPTNLGAWGVLAAQGVHDAANVVLDLGGFAPGPLGQWSSGLRAATSAVDFYEGMPSSNASVQGNANTMSNSNPFSTLSGHQDASGVVSNQGTTSAFDAIVASVDAEVAYQLPIYERIQSDLTTISALDELNLTEPSLGVTATQLASLYTQLPAIQNAFDDYTSALQQLAGHPTMPGLAEEIANGLATVEATTNAAFFQEVTSQTLLPHIVYTQNSGTAQYASLAPNASFPATAGDLTPIDPAAANFPGARQQAQSQSVAGGTNGGFNASTSGADATIYAAIQGSDGSIQRLSFTASQGYGFFFAPNTYYQITAFDPQTNSIGEAFLRSGPSGQNTAIPLVGLSPDPAAPGADGLTPTEAFVIGVSNATADNLVPGVTDLAALQEGLYNGSVLPGTTGIVASLALMGSAQAVALAGSLGNGLTTYAYVATGSYGLAVVDVTNPDAPVALGQISLGGNATGVAVSNALGIAAVANGGNLAFVNVSDPAQLSVIQTVAAAASVVQIIGGTVYANNGGSLDSFDVATGTLLQTLSLGGGTLTGIAVQGSTIYTMDSNDVLRVIDTSSGAMVLDGSVTLPYGGNQIFVANNVVYVGAESVSTAGGYLTVDVSNPAAPALIEGPDNRGIGGAAISLNGSGTGLSVQEGLTGGGQTVNFASVFNTSNPSNTGQFITQYNLPSRPYGVAIGDGIGFVADGGSGLAVLNYLAPDTAGVPPVIDSVTDPVDVDPTTAGIQLYEGVPISVSATVTDDVQVRNVELLLNGTVVANAVAFPFALTATMPSIATPGTNEATLQVEAIDTGGNTTLSAPVPIELVPDTRPLQLLSQSLSEGAILSQFDRTISLTFSKPLNPATVTRGDFEIVTQAGSLVALQSLELSANDQVVSLNFGAMPVGPYKLVIDAPQITDDNAIALGSGTLTTDFSVQQFSAIFTNAAGGSWNTASNWNGDFVPGPFDSVYVGNAIGAAVNYDGNTDSVAQLVVSGSGQFNVTGGQLNVTGLLEADELITVGGGGFSAQGSVSINGLGAIQVNNRSTSLDNVAIAAGGQIQIGNNNYLYAAGTFTNAGLIALNSGNNDTEFDFGGNLTLNGTGVVQLSDNANNYIDGNSAAVTLTNAGNIIRGAGTIGTGGSLTLVNQAGGTIDATSNGNWLAINGVTVTNAGLLEGTGAASLAILGSSVNNAGGTIAAPVSGSYVQFRSSSIVGGTLSDANGGIIQSIDRGVSLNNLTLSTGSDLHVTNNSYIYLAGTFTNKGTVYLDSGNSDTELDPTGTTTLTGGGAIQMSNNASNYLDGQNAAATLINANNTIQGAGTIGWNNALTLINQTGGTIDATSANNWLAINGVTVTNAGLLEGTGPASLAILSSSVNNAGGTISAPVTGSYVQLRSSSIVGGTLTDANGGIIQSIDRGVSLDGITLSAGSDLHVANNNFIYLNNTITNKGTIYLDSTNSDTELDPDGTTTLNGGGVIQMSDNGNNYIAARGTATTLINVNNEIEGGGSIGADGGLTLVNQASGTINATATNNALVLISTSITNAGLLEGTGPAPLAIVSSSVANSGTIAAPVAGSAVNLASAGITGGTLSDANGGVIQETNRYSTLDNVTLGASSNIHVLNNQYLSLADTFTNNGTVFLDSTNSDTQLDMGGTAPVTLTGGGVVQLSDNGGNSIDGIGAAVTLINVNNTIRGAGQIGASGGLTLVNQASGTIDATGTANALVLYSDTIANAGLLEGTGPAPLTISSSSVTNIGTISAPVAGSAVNLASSEITGGTLSDANGGVIQETSRGSTLDNVTLSASSNIHVLNFQYLYLADTFTNNGTVFLDSANNDTQLDMGGTAPVTLTGGGVIQLSDNGNNSIDGIGATVTLTNVNNTILGAGQIGAGGGLTLINDAAGAIDASATNDALILYSDTINNAGLLEATGAAPLIIRSTSVTNSGTIQAAAAGDVVDLQSASISGGLLLASNGGVIQATDRGSVLTNVDVQVGGGGNLVVLNNEYLYLQGTITNQGTVSLGSTNSDTRLIAIGTVVFTGKGQVVLSDNGNNTLASNGTAASFINLNNTVSGGGQIGDESDALLTFTNGSSGIIDATGGNALRIELDGATLTNTGLIEATSTAIGNGGLLIQSTVIDNTGSNNAGIIESAGPNSHVDLRSSTILGGTLTTAGGGLIQEADQGSLLDNVTIAQSSYVLVDNGEYLYLNDTISNAGSIVLGSSNNDTRLISDGTVTLTGTGVVQLSDNSNNSIHGVGGAVLINAANTIEGSGTIGDGNLSFTNQGSGVVDATGSGNRLVIAGGVPITNGGLIEDTGPAGLGIIGTAINNSGTIAAPLAGSHVDLQSGTISGGVLTTANGGYFQAVDRGSVLNGVTIATGGVVAVDNNDYLALQGTITNQGTIQVNSGNNDTRLNASGSVTLTGGGAIVLSDNSSNTIGGAVLTNVNNTIQGAGTIGDGSLSFINQGSGVVDATGTANRLVIAGGVPVTNTGLIEDTGRAGLGIISTTINNSGGTIAAAAANAHVDLQSATINGGVLSTSANAFFQAVDRGTTLNGVTIAAGGLVAVDNNEYLFLAGTLSNQGTIQVNSGNNDTRLMIDPGLTLSGGGLVQMSNNINNSIFSNGTSVAFTDLNDTIEGAGTFGDGKMTLTIGATGTIDANDSNGLTLNTGSNTVGNGGVLQSSGSGGLSVTGGGGVANSGTIWADGDGLYVAGSVTGTGADRITGSATLRIGGSVAAGQTISFDTGSTGTLRLDDSQQFTGTISGLAANGGNALDLSDISFINTATTTATFNAGTLTVTDGIHVATIALSGTYANGTFVTSSDGHGGTTVVDPTQSGGGGVTAGASLSAVLGGFQSAIMQADLVPGAPDASVGPGLSYGATVGGAFSALTADPALLPIKPGWLAT
jgi:hypothetical protein